MAAHGGTQPNDNTLSSPSSPSAAAQSLTNEATPRRRLPADASDSVSSLPTAPEHNSAPTSRGHSSTTPLTRHSLRRYLSSSVPEREEHADSFPSLLRHIPPWLLPRYNGKRRVIRSTLLRPLCRMLVLTLILAALIPATLLYSLREGRPEEADYRAVTEFDWPPINPRSYLSPWNASFGDQYDVLLDGHSHSRYSDGRMNSETLLKWHIANGYNAVVVSDHNTVEGGLAAQKIALAKYSDKITVIPGMELTCCRLHMNLIGINETIDFAIKKWPTDDELRATIARAHELGGLAIVNHIPWSNSTEWGYQLPRMQHHPSREELVAMGVDGFEIANGDVLDTTSLKFSQEHNLLLITGTDVHYPDTGAHSWTTINTNGNRTAEGIMAQLRARRTSFIFDPTGTQNVAYSPSNPAYVSKAPPTLLGQYFQMFWTDQTGMYSFSPEGGFCHEHFVYIHYQLIGYFIAWVLVGFLIFEASRLLLVGCIWGPFQRRKRYYKELKGVDSRKKAGKRRAANPRDQEEGNVNRTGSDSESDPDTRW